MNNEKLTESAMRRGKKSAPSQGEPGQGGRGGESRRTNITPSASANQENHVSQPAAAQRARLLAMLRRGGVSTLQARAANIMSPAARIFELKAEGNEIITTRLPNRVGVYHLVGEAGHGDE